MGVVFISLQFWKNYYLLFHIAGRGLIKTSLLALSIHESLTFLILSIVSLYVSYNVLEEVSLVIAERCSALWVEQYVTGSHFVGMFLEQSPSRRFPPKNQDLSSFRFLATLVMSNIVSILLITLIIFVLCLYQYISCRQVIVGHRVLAGWYWWLFVSSSSLQNIFEHHANSSVRMKLSFSKLSNIMFSLAMMSF